MKARALWTVACVVLGAALAGAGCPGKTKIEDATPMDADKAKSSSPRKFAAAADHSTKKYDDGGKTVRKFDLNKDEVADVWKVFETRTIDGRPTEVIVRKYLDINFDGKVDIWSHYDAEGNLVKEELDLDADERVDVTTYYENGKVARKEEDHEFDTKPDVFKYYEEGKLVRKELDTNNDGAIDEWHYFEDGVLDRVGKDMNGDGKVDSWERMRDSAPAARPAPTTPATGAPASPAPLPKS